LSRRLVAAATGARENLHARRSARAGHVALRAAIELDVGELRRYFMVVGP